MIDKQMWMDVDLTNANIVSWKPSTAWAGVRLSKGKGKGKGQPALKRKIRWL
jgi:hypothetical protein